MYMSKTMYRTIDHTIQCKCKKTMSENSEQNALDSEKLG